MGFLSNKYGGLRFHKLILYLLRYGFKIILQFLNEIYYNLYVDQGIHIGNGFY